MKKIFDPDYLFHLAERIIYIFIGVILTISAFFLTYTEIDAFFEFGKGKDPIIWIVEIISKSLLLIMIVEILYTVRVSFRTQVLSAEPFLIVGLIAAVRRILLISVETAYLPEKFQVHMLEIGVLGALIMVFVLAITLLRRNCNPAV